MNYFITGGTGFIGTHLTNLLQELHPECNVYNLDIVEPGTPLPSVEDYKPALRKGQKLASTFIRCDVRKPIVLEGVNVTADDVIFNFAAVHRTPGHPDYAYFETNVLGAENVTAFAEKYGIKKIVFTSSIAPYGAAEELKEETTVPTPNTPYGISKLVAEKIHMIWQARNQAERQLTIVRPGVCQLFATHHGAVIVHDLTAKSHLCQSGEPEQVYSCFGVPVPFQNAAGLGFQREHVSRTAEVAGVCFRIGCHAGCQTTLHCGNTGGGVDMVNGNGERGFMVVGVVRNHLRQSQPDNVVMVHGHA